MKKVEVDSGKHDGVPTEAADKVKVLERKVSGLRQANDNLRKTSAYFMQAADRPFRSYSLPLTITAVPLGSS